jgi:hypothetical protein
MAIILPRRSTALFVAHTGMFRGRIPSADVRFADAPDCDQSNCSRTVLSCAAFG